jgi:hypothetical protein
VQQLNNIQPPMITCEAVLAEATYLTREIPDARAALIEMVGEDFLSIGIALTDHHSAFLQWCAATLTYRCCLQMPVWSVWQKFIRKAQRLLWIAILACIERTGDK